MTGLENTRSAHPIAITADRRAVANTEEHQEETNRLSRVAGWMGETGLGVWRLKGRHKEDSGGPGMLSHQPMVAFGGHKGADRQWDSEVPRPRSQSAGSHTTDVRFGITVSHPPNGDCN